MSKNLNIFNMVKKPDVPKSVMDLSHEVKLSCNFGELIPICTLDCLPGDKVKIDNEALVRLMPMVAPVMHRFNVTFHRYFVPKRLLWEHWDEYVSLTKIGTPAELPVHPYVTVDPVDMIPSGGNDRLMNYMGMPYQYDPVNQNQPVDINPMRFAAYQFIYNEYYRDQNLISEQLYQLTDGNNTPNLYNLTTLRRRAWQHDYFTSGLPFVQKGDPVLMPLTFNDVPVKIDDAFKPNPADTTVSWNGTSQSSGSAYNPSVLWDTPDAALPTDDLFAKTSEMQTQTTINDLRRANAIQKFQERLARVGSRFTEFLKGIFDVESRDSRLQRPEYFGGDVKPITISEVLNTTGTATLPQGNMAGHGATYINGNDSSYFAEEHGYVIVIMNIQPVTAYQQGIDKEFLKINHPTEHYLPDLANLGEQETQVQELYAYTNNADGVFNYLPRWSEHRYMPSRVCGQMATSLNYWHAGRIFDSEPAFNINFIECDQATPDRIFAVTAADEEKLIVQVHNSIQAVRPIPKYGTPAL